MKKPLAKRFMFRLLPRTEKYFELFRELAANLTVSTKRLQQLFDDFGERARYADQIKDLEHTCDELTHRIIVCLNQTFITPIDREDIHALATGLDDVMDAIDYTARRVVIYHVEEPSDHARKMTDVLVRIVAKLNDAVIALEHDGERVLEVCREIHTLENEGDNHHHEAMERLFSEETNAITILKMKEIYEKMERMVDKCEDVANVLETIVLKNT